MMADLEAFIAHHGRLDQVWGQVDCCLVMADWAIWLGQADPAADLRGSYMTEDGCREVVRRAGGLVPLIQVCADRSGWKRIDRPFIGAVGVIGSRKVVNRQFGAIFNGRWMVRLEQGFVPFMAQPIAIWGTEECL